MQNDANGTPSQPTTNEKLNEFLGEYNDITWWPKPYISVSALKCFDSCPFSFYMKYVLGIQPPPSERQTDGSSFQEALNALYKGEDWKQHVMAMSPTKRGIASLLVPKAHPIKDIVSLDEPYDVDFGFGIPFRFVPDIYSSSEGIVENKFTTGYYNERMVKDEKQATLYFLGIRKLFGVNPRVRYQLFNTRKKSVEMVELEKSEFHIDMLMDWISLKLKEIRHCMKTGVWHSPAHGFCDFPNTCPMAKNH